MNAYLPAKKQIVLDPNATLYAKFHEEAHRDQHLSSAFVFWAWYYGRVFYCLDYVVTLWIEWDAMRRSRKVMQALGVWTDDAKTEAYRGLKSYMINFRLIRAVLFILFITWLSSCSRAQDIDVRPAPTPTATPKQIPFTVALPSPPPLTPHAKAFLLSTGGRGLIFEFETGGRSGYNPHPEWPGGASGVTVGVGYDLGYYSSSVIEHDWSALQDAPRARLERVSGKTGQRARTLLSDVRDIYVQWQIATDVFDKVDIAREYANAKKAMPGFEDCRSNCQAALLSLGFNRGWSFNGPNRTEMRDIRDVGVPHQDYARIAQQLRKMIRVWRGTDIERGMMRRRLAEAILVETP